MFFQFREGKVFQVSTHSHKYKHPLKPFRPHKGTYTERPIMHQDWVKLPPGEKVEFFIEGPGIIETIWLTITPFSSFQAIRYDKIESTRWVYLRIYYDNETLPSVDVPIGDFFGCGFGLYRQCVSRYFGMTSGGYYCNWPMPFRKMCRIEFVNTHPHKTVNAFYAAITYRKVDSLSDDVMYFHAVYHREFPTRYGIPFTILDIEGKGIFCGTTLSMRNLEHRKLNLLIPLNLSFLEGNVKIYVDDQSDIPSLEYTGTEDYFMGGWYYNKGEFCAPYNGTPYKSLRKSAVTSYRIHETDAIPFDKRIKVTIHHGEFDEVKTDYSCVAYWYQFEPHDTTWVSSPGGGEFNTHYKRNAILIMSLFLFMLVLMKILAIL